MATLLDLNRASVVVEHPIVMAVVYYVLLAHLERRGGKISKVKNKLAEQPFTQPPNIHVNLESKTGWVSEVQIHFGDILKLKDMQHKYYELNRADKEKPELFLMPVFQAKKANSGNEVKAAVEHKAQNTEVAELQKKDQETAALQEELEKGKETIADLQKKLAQASEAKASKGSLFWMMSKSCIRPFQRCTSSARETE